MHTTTGTTITNEVNHFQTIHTEHHLYSLKKNVATLHGLEINYTASGQRVAGAQGRTIWNRVCYQK